MMDLDSDDDDMNDVLWGQVNDCMMDTEQQADISTEFEDDNPFNK